MSAVSELQKSHLFPNVQGNDLDTKASPAKKTFESFEFKDIALNFELSSEQIQRNAAILYTQREVTADDKGNLIPRSILTKFFSLSEPELEKSYKAILATLDGIRKKELSSDHWKFPLVSVKPFRIGYDKLAMRILADENQMESLEKISTST